MKPTVSKSRINSLRVIRGLVIVLLILAIFFLGKQVDWLLVPVQQFFSIVGFPLILAGVLYYLMKPLVDRLERTYHVNRPRASIGLFVRITALIVLGLEAIITTIRNQTLILINDSPTYRPNVITEVHKWLHDPPPTSLRYPA